MTSFYKGELPLSQQGEQQDFGFYDPFSQNTYTPQIANQIMPAQTPAPVRHDIMYSASPMGAYNPFFTNGQTQGQAAAAANTTTTTPATTTPAAQTYGFTGTNPFIPRGLNEEEFKAQSVGMASGGLTGIAGALQNRGRGEDSMLVHMTPGEVRGLQALAQAHGGSLTTNPSTGLPEAGFLSSILPTIVGAGVGVATGNPMLGAAAAGGLSYATNGGNLNKSIMSGVGAYGGAGLYSNLAGAGASALAPQGVAAGDLAISQAFGAEGISSMAEATSLLNAGKIDPTTYQGIASTFSQGYASGIGNSGDALMAGIKSPGALSNYLAPLSMLGVSALGSFGPNNQNSISSPNPGYIRPYTFKQTVNPNYGQPGQPYFTQQYTAQTPIIANQFGSQSLPSSGMAEGGLAENDIFPRNYRDNTQYATPTQMPASAEVIRSDYDAKTDPYTGQASGFAAGGIMQKGLGGYSDGGQLLKGPGDGVSDSIPAQIGRKQPARLADGEFVVPARIVSELGNGSTDAGARQLYKMMDRIQSKRRKAKAVAADTKSYKELPA